MSIDNFEEIDFLNNYPLFTSTQILYSNDGMWDIAKKNICDEIKSLELNIDFVERYNINNCLNKIHKYCLLKDTLDLNSQLIKFPFAFGRITSRKKTMVSLNDGSGELACTLTKAVCEKYACCFHIGAIICFENTPTIRLSQKLSSKSSFNLIIDITNIIYIYYLVIDDAHDSVINQSSPMKIIKLKSLKHLKENISNFEKKINNSFQNIQNTPHTAISINTRIFQFKKSCCNSNENQQEFSLRMENLLELCKKYKISNDVINDFKRKHIDDITILLLKENEIEELVTSFADRVKLRAIILELKEKKAEQVKHNDDDDDDDDKKTEILSCDGISEYGHVDNLDCGKVLDVNSTDDEQSDDEGQDDVDQVSVPLPVFSKKIDSCLMDGNLWTNNEARSQFIAELAIYFKSNNILINKSYHYKSIIITIFNKYPHFCEEMKKITEFENKNKIKSGLFRKKLIQPWRIVSKILSRKMRNIRHKPDVLRTNLILPTFDVKEITNNHEKNNGNDKIKQFSSPAISNQLNEIKLNSPQIKRKLNMDDCFASKRKEINFEQDLHEELIDLLKSKKNNKNKDQISILLEKTFNYRRSKIENSKISFHEILKSFSYIVEVKHLETEFSLIIKRPISVVKQNVKRIMVILWSNFNVTNSVELNGHIKTFQLTEKKIGTKNSLSLILIEKVDDTIINSNEIKSPCLYFKDGYIYVVYEKNILAKFDVFFDSIVYLFGIYFTFDLSYPECFKQILGLMHEFLFSEFPNTTCNRTTGYMNISNLLNRKIE